MNRRVQDCLTLIAIAALICASYCIVASNDETTAQQIAAEQTHHERPTHHAKP